MGNGLTFRAITALTVTAYALLLGVLVAAIGDNLWSPIGDLAPQVSWLMRQTTEARVSALRAVDEPGLAALYAMSVAVSFATIGALAAAGFAWGVMNKGATVLGVDKSLGYLTALAGLYAVSTLFELAVHASGLHPHGGLHAIPGLWFAAMIPSAAILARIGSLIAHDAGALIAITIAGEPGRIAELVTTAEATRGAASYEARLARLIASRRAG